MPNDFHPADERLAAYAGGDRDAVSDRALVEHLSTCDRCQPIIDELALLRGALAALPDLAPSRPLRLIPPVPAAPRQAAPLPWLRRLLAPAMFGGAALVLVGAVGMSGAADGLKNISGAGASLTSERASDDAGAPAQGATESARVSALDPDAYTGRSDAPRPGTDSEFATDPPSSPPVSQEITTRSDRGAEAPWLTLLIAGAAIFTAATVLRFTVVPRAG